MLFTTRSAAAGEAGLMNYISLMNSKTNDKTFLVKSFFLGFTKTRYIDIHFEIWESSGRASI